MRAFFQVSMMFPVLTRPTRKSAQIRAKMRKNFKNHLDKGASACYNIACRSERIGYSSLAQSVERVTVNHDAVGSSPTGGAIQALLMQCFFIVRNTLKAEGRSRWQSL